MEEKLEKIKTEPILITRFEDIREPVDINPTVDDFVSVFDNEEYRKHFFEEAKYSFEFALDKEKFIDNIQQEPNKESFKYLKKIRRLGLILKAAYRFVDSGHKCGKSLDVFTRLLGEFNDSYWVAHSKEKVDEIVDMIDGLDFSVDFIDTSDFKEYALDLLSEVEDLLEKNELPIKKFHSLRKKLRNFSNFMQVLAAENYGKASHWLFYSILQLSTELGDAHDDLVQKGLKGEINYHESVVKINPQVATEFKKLKPFIEKVYGLV